MNEMRISIKLRGLTVLASLAAMLFAVTDASAIQPVISRGGSITAVMSGAAATTNPTSSIDHIDLNTTARENDVGSLNGVTPVTPRSATTPFQVTSIGICNIDTAAVTVTIKKSNRDDTTALALATVTLQVGDTLTIGAGGVRVRDNAGQIKQSGVSTAVEPFEIPVSKPSSESCRASLFFTDQRQSESVEHVCDNEGIR
jgi:hypothetical protein